MTKLFIKTMLGLIIILGIIIVIINVSLNKLLIDDRDVVNLNLTQGVFVELQNILAKTPQPAWQHILKHLKPVNGHPVEIININKLKLPARQLKRVIAGGRVIFYEHESLFYGYGESQALTCQRIGSTDYVLALPQGPTVRYMVSTLSAWMVRLLVYRLEVAPKDLVEATLKQLQIQYGLPLAIKSADNIRMPQIQLQHGFPVAIKSVANHLMPQKLKQQLNATGMTYLPAGKKNPYITTLYARLPKLNKILVIGPIDYAKYSRTMAFWNYFQYAVIFILSILAVIILTWLFSRNINKIYKMTQKYSHGDFSYQPKFSRFSTLRNLYNNVVLMGDNLRNYIQSHYNMTRFVAHEARTPLATMQLAFERVEEDEGISHESKVHLASIKQDMNDLNKLISSFLLYSQSSTHELTINKEQADIGTWMTQIIGRYQAADVQVVLNTESLEKTIFVDFDPQLLKHAVDNLLTNSLKYAKQKIEVNLLLEKNSLTIHIDDDGKVILQEDRAQIFQAFASLETSSSLGKHIGLGLSIAQSIVELHGGSISVVESPHLGGSRFSIQLPLRRA